MNNKCTLTIGVLGSYYCPNISYNVNTYIGQNFTDYELIFSFDSKQCIPVSSIIDSLNAHEFEIENRVKIFEDHNNPGLVCQVSKIVNEAKGRYILLVSIEDAFYDSDALNRVVSQIEKFPTEISSFRTLVHTDAQWLVYPSDELKQNTGVLCYPVGLLKETLNTITYHQNNFMQLQKALSSSAALLSKINYTDENVIVHMHPDEKEELSDYYCYFDSNKEELTQLLQEQSNRPDLHKLNQSQIAKITQLLSAKADDKTLKKIHDEIYRSYRLVKESIWGIPDSTLQYIKTLSYICENSLWKNWFQRISMQFRLHSLNPKRKLL